MHVLYPAESFSVGIHIFIMIIATGVCIIGLISGYLVKQNRIKWANLGQGQATDKWETVLKDIIPVGGIILALIGPLVPALSNPILDYDVTGVYNQNNLTVKINNYGFTCERCPSLFYSAAAVFCQF